VLDSLLGEGREKGVSWALAPAGKCGSFYMQRVELYLDRARIGKVYGVITTVKGAIS